MSIINKNDLKVHGVKRKTLDYELLKRGFMIDDKGSLLTIENTFLSNAILVPVRERLVYDDFSNKRRIIDFICILSGEVFEESIDCPVELIDNTLLNKLRIQLGLAFKLSKNRLLCNEFLQLVKNLDIFTTKVREYSQIRWVKDNNSYAYMDGSRLITSDKLLAKKDFVISKSLIDKKHGINTIEISKKEAYLFSQKC